MVRQSSPQVVEQTIRCYLLLTAFYRLGISFINATYVTFLLSKGLNLFEANLVNMVFFTTLFLFEIPTGAMADVFGRKASFVAACSFFAISMFLYAASETFWQFAFAEALAAIGHTFASGAFQAWLVDKLRHHGYEGSLTGIFAKEQQIMHGCSIIGAVAGAYLADVNIALPWVGGGCVFFVTLVLALAWMKEEYFVRQPFSVAGGLVAMRDTAKTSIHYGVRHKAIRFVLLMGTAQFFAVMAPNMQWQPFFSQFIESKATLGYIFSSMALAMMLGAWFAPKFLARVGSERRALALTQIVIGGGIAATIAFHWLPAALGTFLIHEVGRGVWKPLKDVYLHDNIPSKERATIVSFESVTHHIGGMMGLLVSGALAQYTSIATAWVVSGGILVASAMLLFKNGKEC
ncbi:MAG: hypothetical protein HY471_00445 [Candidatus Sungbacteria bacterium]|nr:hypothetical protein [Candidatus Sungbacteria bacterium]